MDWKDYEDKVYKYFLAYYPGSKILFDQKILGKFSKVVRQIDILIKTKIADKTIRIVVDCKFFSKKIDVKLIESFSSMVEDVEADQGILITNLGYSKAATNRAHYGNQNIELDILNLDAIKRFQGLVAMPYVGHFTVSLLAPFGWILDLDNPINNFAVLHQRGITLSEAQKRNEWMYVNFWDRKGKDFSIENLIEIQNNYMQDSFKIAFKYLKGAKRKDKVKSKIRIADVDSYNSLEVTGYLEFKSTIFFIVLFTPKESLEKNLRKMHYMLALATPMDIYHDNTKVIKQLLTKVKETVNPEDKADMFHKVANWYKEMDDIDNALVYYRKSIDVFPSHYTYLKRLIFELLSLKKYGQAEIYSGKFFDSAPKNPTVFQDLIDIYMENERPDLLQSFLEELFNKNNDKEILGNISFHQGQLALFLKKKKEALKYFQISKSHFKIVLPKSHQVFETLNEYIKGLT